MAEIATFIAEKLVEYSIRPIVNQFKYLWCYSKNIQNLKDELQDLEDKRKDVQRRVESAEKNAEDINDDVKTWLENVDKKKEEAKYMLGTAANSITQWLCVKCPNLKLRYSSGRKATKIAAAILELKTKSGEFQEVSYPKQPTQFPIPVHDVKGLETRVSKNNEIVGALKGEETFILGICGMAGVGKTTMAKEIANEVKGFFDDVAFVVVSKDPVINKVQDHIAEQLGLKIEDDNETMRAGRLNRRLTSNIDKKILIILDDVWEEINLEMMGFPKKDAFKGLKVLLTSRHKKVCKEMGADPIYEVNVLPENEALKLLKDAAEISNDTSEDVKQLATLVAKECRGLPLSLVVTGKALIGEEEYAWRDALHQLQRSTVLGEEKVYKSIELSYNKLKNEGMKSLFLLCSLFPEDYSISIETLVRYARGLETLRDTTTLSELRDRVYSVVAHLKSCYLLLSGYKEDKVKLHDVVRDFCLLIASRGENKYMVKHSGVKEWPKQDKNDPHTAISLTFDKPPNELPSGLEYPNLNVLRLVCGYGETHIHNEFFSNMKQLKIVEFEFSHNLNHFPSSLQSLTSLQTLCLHSWHFTTPISTIGSLKNLEILSFYESQLIEFPIEIAQLSKLKLLDLRFRDCPHPLPHGVLSRLNEIEELYLGGPFATQNQVEDESIIGELSSLSGLQNFQICVKDPRLLLQMLKRMRLEKLQSFEITCASQFLFGKTYHVTRSLYLENMEASMIKQPVIQDLLLQKTEDLLLDTVEGPLKNHVSELDEDGFMNLKRLDLRRCSFEYLIDTVELSFNARTAFNKLEELVLYDLRELKGICNGNLPPGAFARLRKVAIYKLPWIENLWTGIFKPPSLCNLEDFRIFSCPEIKRVFSESAAKCLLNLGSLRIANCEMLEHVISRDSTENEVTDQVLELRKLKSLSLQNLSNLMSFRSQPNVDAKALFNQVTCPNMEKLDVHGLRSVTKILGDEIQPKAFQKLRSMSVSFCAALRTIAQPDSIKALQNLESLDVKFCEDLDVLFELEGLKVAKDETRSIFARLTSLELAGLPKLVHIVRRVPQGRICIFQNLTAFSMFSCYGLRHLFTPSTASSLASLRTLKLYSCEAIEEIIRREETEMEEPSFLVDNEGRELNKLVFPKLENITLVHLKSLRMFCSENITLEFPSLHNLDISNCPAMEKFSLQELVTKDETWSILARLTSVRLSHLPKLVHIARRVPQGRICIFQNLTAFSISSCHGLRHLFTPSTASSLASLRTLTLYSCEAIEEIIRREETEMEEPSFLVDNEGRELNKLVFPKLSNIYLWTLKSLRMFCSENITLEFPSLHNLDISNCPAMEKFSLQEPVAPKLKKTETAGEGQK